MNPPWSMVLFTIFTGAAQGLLLALMGLDMAAAAGLMVGTGRDFRVVGAVLVLLLSGAGLIAATFHLGRPLRGWRAAAMWRTSWLSREVIVLPTFMLSVAVWGLAHQLRWPALVPGIVASALALLLYLCTGMIYGAVAAIREWATPLTPISFASIGIASGLLLALALAAFSAPAATTTLLPVVLSATAAATALRAATMWRNRHLAPRSTLQTAIGMRHPVIRPSLHSATPSTFNTREFNHGRSAVALRHARWCAVLFGAVAPLLLAGVAGALGLVLLVLLQLVGLVAERWLFFADAQHPQNLYHRQAI